LLIKVFGAWSIFYPACLEVNLRGNWKRRLGTLQYAASQFRALRGNFYSCHWWLDLPMHQIFVSVCVWTEQQFPL